jgi:hypothetical protein
MKIQITRISIHQTSKVFAILYFIIVALFTIPAGFYYAFYLSDMINAAALFVAPLFGLIIYYVVIAIAVALYNLVAKAFGGFEFTTAEIPQHQSIDNTK